MSHFLIFIFLFVVSFRCGLSLYCQVTNIEKLLNTREVSHSAQDCNTYMNTITAKFFENEDQEKLKNPSTPFSCFTARVTTDDPSSKFVVKGCVPTGDCEKFVVPTVKREAQLQGVAVKKMTCAECKGERCNAY